MRLYPCLIGKDVGPSRWLFYYTHLEIIEILESLNGALSKKKKKHNNVKLVEIDILNRTPYIQSLSIKVDK